MNLRTVFLSVIAILLIILLFLFIHRFGLWLIKEDSINSADAIIVLMGSPCDRINHSVDLYEKDLADRIIMVETNDDLNPNPEYRSHTQLSKELAVSKGMPNDSIVILKGGAESTNMEAKIIRDYLNYKPEMDTLILVTSSYHTKRASTIFETAFRKDSLKIHLVSSPSKYTEFDPKNWWKSKREIQIVMMEYLKLLNFAVFDKKKL